MFKQILDSNGTSSDGLYDLSYFRSQKTLSSMSITIEE